MASAAQHTDRERGMALLGYRNLRDLGGLAARDGRVVVSGRLFRGSSPSRFEALEHQALRALALRSIIDLRMTDEVLTSNIQAAVPTLSVFHHPLFSTVRSNWIAPSDQAPSSTASRYLEMLDDGADALANIVLRIAQPPTTPVLICCAAGRDRTGIVTACLLDLLEVHVDVIAADYAHSDRFVQDGGRAHQATMLEFLQLLRARHGSTRAMLGAYGVSDGIVEGLQQELLVPSASRMVYPG